MVVFFSCNFAILLHKPPKNAFLSLLIQDKFEVASIVEITTSYCRDQRDTVAIILQSITNVTNVSCKLTDQRDILASQRQ